jgi:hypothetical protein
MVYDKRCSGVAQWEVYKFKIATRINKNYLFSAFFMAVRDKNLKKTRRGAANNQSIILVRLNTFSFYTFELRFFRPVWLPNKLSPNWVERVDWI